MNYTYRRSIYLNTKNNFILQVLLLYGKTSQKLTKAWPYDNITCYANLCCQSGSAQLETSWHANLTLWNVPRKEKDLNDEGKVIFHLWLHFITSFRNTTFFVVRLEFMRFSIKYFHAVKHYGKYHRKPFSYCLGIRTFVFKYAWKMTWIFRTNYSCI